jgi:hypothetical protein
MMGQRKARNRSDGRFHGRRVNCEYVPLLPASAARQVIEDPRKIPYLLLWKDGSDGQVKEAVRLIACREPHGSDWTGWIEVKRTDGTRTMIRTVEHQLLKAGGKTRLFVCPVCNEPRRALYGWEPGGQWTRSVRRSSWQCRTCAGLRYASEGGALLICDRGIIRRLFGVGRSDRPQPWYPYVFTSPQEAAESGFPFVFLSRRDLSSAGGS